MNELSNIDFSVTSVTAKSDKWIGYSQCDYLKYGRTANLVHIVTSGTRMYEFDDNIFTVEKGCVLFIPDGTHYKTWSCNECSGIGICFKFKEDMQIVEGVYHNCRDEHGNYLNLFERLLESYMNSPRMLLHQNSLLLRIIDHMTAESSPETKYSVLLSPSIHFIREHYCEKLPVSVYAAECNLSESYFRRIFFRYMNMTPIEYRDNMRLDEAKRLRMTGMSMSEIAEAVGFCDAAYLRKLFKKTKGHSIDNYTGMENV